MCAYLINTLQGKQLTPFFIIEVNKLQQEDFPFELMHKYIWVNSLSNSKSSAIAVRFLSQYFEIIV